MDTTLMSNVVTSSTSLFTSLIGALFSFITSILPTLLGLAAIGFCIWGIGWLLGHFHKVGRHGK